MAPKYIETLTALLEAVQPNLPSGCSFKENPIEVKHFFGGVAGYVDGHIFMSLTKVGLALKLPEADREQLFRSKQAKRLRYFSKAPVKKIRFISKRIF